MVLVIFKINYKGINRTNPTKKAERNKIDYTKMSLFQQCFGGLAVTQILWHHWHYLYVPCLRMWHFSPLIRLFKTDKHLSACLMSKFRGICQHLFCFGAMFIAVMKCKVVSLFTFFLYILWITAAIKNEIFFLFPEWQKIQKHYQSLKHLSPTFYSAHFASI